MAARRGMDGDLSQQAGHCPPVVLRQHRRGGARAHPQGQGHSLSPHLPLRVQHLRQRACLQAARPPYRRHQQGEGRFLLVPQPSRGVHHWRELQQAPFTALWLRQGDHAPPARASKARRTDGVRRCRLVLEPDEFRVQEYFLAPCRWRQWRVVRLSAISGTLPKGRLQRDVHHQPVPSAGKGSRL